MPMVGNLPIPRDETYEESQKFDEQSGMTKAERLLRYSRLVAERRTDKMMYAAHNPVSNEYLTLSRIPVSRRKEMEGRPLFEMGLPFTHLMAGMQTLLQFADFKEAYTNYNMCTELQPSRFRCIDEASTLFQRAGKRLEEMMTACPSFQPWVNCINDCTGEFPLCRWQQVDFENCMLRKYPEINYVSFPNIGKNPGPLIHRDGQGYEARADMLRPPSIWTDFL